jgi:uncharacterized protein YjbK
MANNIEAKLKELLSKEEIESLRKLQLIKDSETRQSEIKKFFIEPSRFELIKPFIDPVWLAYEIFINKTAKRYEF